MVEQHMCRHNRGGVETSCVTPRHSFLHTMDVVLTPKVLVIVAIWIATAVMEVAQNYALAHAPACGAGAVERVNYVAYAASATGGVVFWMK